MAKHGNLKPKRKADPSAATPTKPPAAAGATATPEMIARGVVAAVVEQVAAVFESSEPRR